MDTIKNNAGLNVDFAPGRAKVHDASAADFAMDGKPFYVRMGAVEAATTDKLEVVPHGNIDEDSVILTVFAGEFLPTPIKKILTANSTVNDLTVWY